MNAANFSFNDWEQCTNQTLHDVPELNQRELPAPPDKYRPGHIKWGSDPKRGHAIQRGRERKRLAANTAFFLSDVLPLIESDLNPAAWKELAQSLHDDPSLYRRGGWVRYALDKRASWIHPVEEPEKIAQVVAMGAQPEAVS